MRKPVFGIFDQVRLKPAYSATETRLRFEILALSSIGIWFPHDEAQISFLFTMMMCLGHEFGAVVMNINFS